MLLGRMLGARVIRTRGVSLLIAAWILSTAAAMKFSEQAWPQQRPSNETLVKHINLTLRLGAEAIQPSPLGGHELKVSIRYPFSIEPTTEIGQALRSFGLPLSVKSETWPQWSATE